MTVFAIPLTAIRASTVRSQATCFQTVQTVGYQQTFHILGLAPGDYYVFATIIPAITTASMARLSSREPFFGASYTKAVVCGLDYTCTDHSLIPVTVQAGEVTGGIAVTDWYPDPGVFPKVPTNVPPPNTLPPEPASFSSAMGAAIYYGQTVGGVYTQSGCPVNRACVTLGDEHDGVDSAYFGANAGSNSDYLRCGIYVFRDSTGWHSVDVRCTSKPAAFPAVGTSGVVIGQMGDNECVHVRRTPGRTGTVVGCLAPGTTVAIDAGPVFVNDADPSLGPVDRLWWHLTSRGWMVHAYLHA